MRITYNTLFVNISGCIFKILAKIRVHFEAILAKIRGYISQNPCTYFFAKPHKINFRAPENKGRKHFVIKTQTEAKLRISCKIQNIFIKISYCFVF